MPGCVACVMTARNIRGLRIKTKCVTNDELVRWFHRFCDEASIFIATTTPRTEGLDTAFSIDLASGEPALAGEGVVLAAWTTRDNRYKAPGMQIGVRTLTKPSTPVFEQMLIARAIANDAAPSQESWDEGTEVGGPTFAELAIGNVEPVPSVPAVGKQTVLGMPSIPKTPEPPAKEAMKPPAKDEAANKPGSSQATRASQAKLGPTAFSFSVPAKIEPTGAMKRLEKPAATATPPAATPVVASATAPVVSIKGAPSASAAPAPQPPPPRTKTIIHAGIVDRYRAMESAAELERAEPVPAPVAPPAPAPVAATAPPQPAPVAAAPARPAPVMKPAPQAVPIMVAPVAPPAPVPAPAKDFGATIQHVAIVGPPRTAEPPRPAEMPRASTPVVAVPVAVRPAAGDTEPPALAPPPVIDESRDESKSTRVPRAATVLGSGPVARPPASYTPSNAYDVSMDENEHTDVTDVDPQQATAAPPFELDYPRLNPADLPHDQTRETKPAKSSIHVQPRKRRIVPMVLAAIVLVGLGGAAAWQFYPRAESTAVAAEPPAPPVAMPPTPAPAPEEAAPAAAPTEQPVAEAPAPVEAPVEASAPAETTKPDEPAPKAAAAAPEPAVRRTAKAVKKAPVKRVSAKPAAKPRPKKKKAAAACSGLDCL